MDRSGVGRGRRQGGRRLVPLEQHRPPGGFESRSPLADLQPSPESGLPSGLGEQASGLEPGRRSSLGSARCVSGARRRGPGLRQRARSRQLPHRGPRHLGRSDHPSRSDRWRDVLQPESGLGGEKAGRGPAPLDLGRRPGRGGRSPRRRGVGLAGAARPFGRRAIHPGQSPLGSRGSFSGEGLVQRSHTETASSTANGCPNALRYLRSSAAACRLRLLFSFGLTRNALSGERH